MLFPQRSFALNVAQVSPFRLARDRQPELMDQPDLPLDQHEHALAGLARLNRWTGVASSMYRKIRKAAAQDSSRPLKILDIASGAGDLPVTWARNAERDGLKLEITTVDISDVAVESQMKRAAYSNVSINALQRDCLSQPLPEGHDVITNSLFLHHLDQVDVVRLVSEMHRVALKRVVVCDLERSRINLGLVAIGARLVTRSFVVHHDASLSVRGAFTREEMQMLCEKAVYSPVQVRRVLPCRMMFVLGPSMISKTTSSTAPPLSRTAREAAH